MDKIKPFLMGIIAALGALFFELSLRLIFRNENSIDLNSLSAILFLAIIIEEFLKFSMVFQISKESIDKTTILKKSFLVGSGFALAEIFFTLLNQNKFENLSFLPILGIFLIHTLTTTTMGFILSQKKNIFLALSLIISILIHLSYNILIIYDFGYSKAIFWVLILYFFIAILVKKNLSLSTFAK